MASISATYHYGGDGDMVSIDVHIENDYPDAMNEARKTAVGALRDLTGIPAADVAFDFDNED